MLDSIKPLTYSSIPHDNLASHQYSHPQVAISTFLSDADSLHSVSHARLLRLSSLRLLLGLTMLVRVMISMPAVLTAVPA